MFDSIDRLDQEIINVQVLDGYFKDGLIRYDKYFMRDDYTETMKKFEKLLEQYKENDNGLELVEEIDEDISTDEVMEVLVADLDIYSIIYKVPEVSIENDEWELLFYTIGEYYLGLNLDSFFLDDMIKLNKFAIARSMVYEEDSISLETYISSLRYLESNILTNNNIRELAEILGEEFKIDAVSLITNKDGSIGIGYEIEKLPVNEELQVKLNEFNTVEDNDDSKSSTSSETNIVSFTKFKKRVSIKEN